MPDDIPNSDDSLAYLRRFPSAADAFAFVPKSTADCMKRGLVFLDTNALLVPYKTGAQSLGAIVAAFAKLKEKSRLIVPGHVAREFLVNRVERIKELYEALEPLSQ